MIELNTSEKSLSASNLKEKLKSLKRTQNKTVIELEKISSDFSNNIENYFIKYGRDDGGISRQFFTKAMEQMFSEYFILIKGTDKYKLKDEITKEEASKAGFLVAFSLINDMPLTKHINSIYIAMMIYKVKELCFDNYFLYAILDQNELGRKIFENMCKEIVKKDSNDYCNPSTYYTNYISPIYGLENINLPFFIKSFNRQITKKILRTNNININKYKDKHERFKASF
mgnify:CR=1 FL=1